MPFPQYSRPFRQAKRSHFPTHVITDVVIKTVDNLPTRKGESIQARGRQEIGDLRLNFAMIIL